MNIVILLFAVYGIAFLIKESEGPWGLMSWTRNQLMKNKYVGVFFYKLFSCFFCVGCHAGWIVYLLSQSSYTWQLFILWMLAGGALSIFMDAIFTKLYKND